MKLNAICLLAIGLVFVGCDFNDAHNHEEHNHHAHSHEGHAHEAHAHESHGPETHNHEEHKKEAHNYNAHKNCTHDHKEQVLKEHFIHKNNGLKTIRVKKTLQEAMGLKTVRTEMRPVNSLYSCFGRFENIPESRQTVSTPLTGRISILVKPLSSVKKGDILFTVHSPEFVSKKREIEILEKRVKVYREINTSNAALENELAVKRAECASLIADADEKDGIVSIKAATDGIVELFWAKNGDWLDTGASVLQLINPKAIRVKALIPSSDVKLLKNDLEAKVGDFSGVTRLGIGDGTGLVALYVVFDGDIDAAAGSSSEVEVYLNSNFEKQLAVPSKAIVKIKLESVVFVKDAHDDEHFIAVGVTPIATSASWTYVKGLHCNAEVVLDGVYELRQAVSGADMKNSGHFHADGTFHDGEH